MAPFYRINGGSVEPPTGCVFGEGGGSAARPQAVSPHARQGWFSRSRVERYTYHLTDKWHDLLTDAGGADAVGRQMGVRRQPRAGANSGQRASPSDPQAVGDGSRRASARHRRPALSVETRRRQRTLERFAETKRRRSASNDQLDPPANTPTRGYLDNVLSKETAK